MYRLPFEFTHSAKLLHFTILGGGSADPPAPLNDATAFRRSRSAHMLRYRYTAAAAAITPAAATRIVVWSYELKSYGL